MRTHYCGAVTAADIGNTVTLCGWAHRRRDHGGVIFIDLRDREGMMQVVIDPDTPEAFKLAEDVRSEFVLKIEGLVRPRPAGTENPNMTTGMVELLTKKLDVLNPSLTPPFQIDDDTINENIRLQYRYLDLRREPMQKNLKLRYRVSKIMRDYLDVHGFMEVETPMLTRSTPEGARDYLVPSRVHDGMFYALPQSPQLFKQLLMVAGVDRYFQITKCFRDEDLRADRQPEFTQVDLETSFMGEEEIMNLVEGMIRDMMKKAQDIDLPAAFPRMTYAEAMHRYGSDKPDMRVTLEIVDVGDAMKDVAFKVFSGPANDPKGRVAALRIPGGAALSRSEIDGYTEFVKIYGAKGLAYIKVNDVSQLNESRPAVAHRQEPLRSRLAHGDGTHRRAKRRPDLLRRRPRQGGQRRARRAAPQDRPREGPRRRPRLGAAVGGRFPDVRIQRGREPLGRAAPSLHRAQGRP